MGSLIHVISDCFKIDSIIYLNLHSNGLHARSNKIIKQLKYYTLYFIYIVYIY